MFNRIVMLSALIITFPLSLSASINKRFESALNQLASSRLAKIEGQQPYFKIDGYIAPKNHRLDIYSEKTNQLLMRLCEMEDLIIKQSCEVHLFVDETKEVFDLDLEYTCSDAKNIKKSYTSPILTVAFKASQAKDIFGWHKKTSETKENNNYTKTIGLTDVLMSKGFDAFMKKINELAITDAKNKS